MIKILAILSLILLISACAPVIKTDYRFSPPPTDVGKMCASGCLDKKSTCVAHCEIAQTNCERINDLKAENAYLRYIEEKTSKGEIPTKEKWRFKSFSGCSKSSCEKKCAENHRICHSSCGGNIIEERRCTAFCD